MSYASSTSLAFEKAKELALYKADAVFDVKAHAIHGRRRRRVVLAAGATYNRHYLRSSELTSHSKFSSSPSFVLLPPDSAIEAKRTKKS
jgi:hypothetical protein